ncbi:MAG: HAMP domain-containing sensor histidine kinase [Mariprofundaceae bacterium]|nr:HAMP domain-containing sensor histidine kinase [Mariprofundaceae bacterium]
MKYLRGLSGVLALWLLAVFFVVAFVGWHQLRDISTIHDQALQLEAVNHKSHTLHELEMNIRKQSAFVHDFLITGTEKNINQYRSFLLRVNKAIDDAANQDIDVAVIQMAVRGINQDAENIFSLPFATGNMEGPILIQEMDKKLVALSKVLMQKHHNMDDSVNHAMRFVAGLHLDMRADFIVSLIVLFALLAGLTIYIYSRMIRPLVFLRSRVSGIGQGENVPHAPDFGDNEIGELSRALNDMGDAIREHQGALIHARSLQAHQEKMQALGLMTANIAHEIGNPLAAASVSLEIVRRKIRSGDSKKAEPHIQHVQEELQRTEDIILNILDYGRHSQFMRAEFDLVAVIDSAIKLVGLVKQARHVHIEYEVLSEIKALLGNVDMLRQVLVNLLLNATDASPKGAVVHVEVACDESVVMLDVSDQGCGIDPEHVEMIFSPMFSTKKKGEGTGLGLSISRDLMQQMGGDLILLSHGSPGCTFRIILPVSNGGDEHADFNH